VGEKRLTPSEFQFPQQGNPGAGSSGVSGIQTVVLKGDPNEAGVYTIATYLRLYTERMTPAQVKPQISPELLNQIDVRVGTILSVTDVANSEKLVALEVSFGDHKRTVLAGMKRERANPREIEGKQALFVVNLEPRTMAGIVSEGMLFDIGYLDGITPVLAMPETHVPDGARAG
jgi:tRNA-binding protein